MCAVLFPPCTMLVVTDRNGSERPSSPSHTVLAQADNGHPRVGEDVASPQTLWPEGSQGKRFMSIPVKPYFM